MPVVSGGDLALQRGQAHKSDVYVSFLIPPILWKARIDDGSIVKGQTSFTFDQGTGSDFGLIGALQEIWVGTTDGDYDVGRLRVRSISTGDGGVTGGVTVAGHSLPLGDDQYLTFLHHYPLRPRYSYLDPSTKVWYMDTILAYTDEHEKPPPVVVAGPHRAGFLDSTPEFTINVDASDSYVIAAGASITSYALSVVSTSGTPTVTFSAVTGLGDIKFTLPGYYWAKYTVTDSNGKSQDSYRCYIVHEDNRASSWYPFVDLEMLEIGGDWDSGGWIAAMSASDNYSFDDIPEHTLVVIWRRSWFGDTEKNITFLPDQCSTIFAGYVRDEAEEQDFATGVGSLDLSIGTVEGKLRQIYSFSASIVAQKTSVDDWFEGPTTMTVGTIAHHILRWRSTLFEVADVIGLMDNTLLRFAFEPDDANLYDMVNSFTYESSIRAKLVCDQGGRMHLAYDIQLLTNSERAALSTVFDIKKDAGAADYGGRLSIPRKPENEVPFITSDGVYWDGSTWDPEDPDLPYATGDWCVIAPGGIGLEEGPAPKDFPLQTVSSLDHLRQIAGRFLAKTNNHIEELRVEFKGDYLGVLDVAYDDAVWTISLLAGDTPRGRAWTDKPLFCRNIVARFRGDEGVFNVNASFEVEADGIDGVETSCPGFPLLGGTIPVIPLPTEVPGALMTGSSVHFKSASGNSWDKRVSQDVLDLIEDPYWRIKQASNSPSDAIAFRCGVGYIKRTTDAFVSVDVDVTPSSNPPNDAGDAIAPTATGVTYFILDGSSANQDEFVVLARWQNASSEWRSWLAFSDDNGTNWTWMSIPASAGGGEDGSNLSLGSEYEPDTGCTASHLGPGYRSSHRSIARLSPFKVVVSRFRYDTVPCGSICRLEACVVNISGQAITFGSWYEIGPGYTVVHATADVYSKIVEVDSDTFVTVEIGLGVVSGDYEAWVAAANVSGNVISQGTAVQLEQQGSTRYEDVAITKLSDSKVLVGIYRYNNALFYVCSISGNSVSVGSAQTFSTLGGKFIQVCTLSDTKVVAVYSSDWQPDTEVYARAGTVSGNTITWGSATKISIAAVGAKTINDNVLDCRGLSDTHFVVSWTEGADNNVRVGSVSGTTITLGTVKLFEPVTSNASDFISLDVYSSAKFLIYYRLVDSGEEQYRIGTVDGITITVSNAIGTGSNDKWRFSQIRLIDISSGTGITWIFDANDHQSSAYIVNGMPFNSYLIESFGTPQEIGINQHQYLSGWASQATRHSVAVLSNTKVVLSAVYLRGADAFSQLRMWVAEISGNTITEGAQHNISDFEWNTPKDSQLDTVDSNTFIVIWLDDTNSSNYTALIQAGNVSGTTITMGNTLDWHAQFGTGLLNWSNVMICVMSSTRAIVMMDYYMALISISGNATAWLSSEYLPTSDHSKHASICKLTDTKFVYGFRSDLTYNYSTRAMIGDISGSSLSFGSEYNVSFDNTENTWGVDVCRLTDSTFAILWIEDDAVTSRRVLRTRVGSVSGTVITFGAQITVYHPISTSWRPYSPRVTRLDDNNYFISYWDGYTGIEAFNIATVTDALAVWLHNGPWAPSGMDSSFVSTSHVLSTSKAIAWRVENDCSPWDQCYATAYIINLVGGSGAGSGGVEGYESIAIGLNIAKGTGSKVWMTLCNDVNLLLYEISLPGLTIDNASDLGAATIAEVIAKTYLAYPFVPFGYDDAVYVFGRMNDPYSLGNPAHVIRTIDGGANFSLIEDGWSVDHCGALILLSSNYMFAIRNRGSQAKLYKDNADNNLVVKVTLPFSAEVAPHGLMIDKTMVYVCSWAADPIMIVKILSPYSVATDITFDHEVIEGVWSIIDL